MARKAIPIENKMLLSVAKHGGSVEKTQMRLDFHGRLTNAEYAKGLEKLKGLAVEEKTHSKGSKRPTTSLTLTLRGRVAAEMLKPGFVPRRFTLDELKAEILERQERRDSWALQLAQDAHDASNWRRAEADRKAKRDAQEAKRAAKEKPPAKHPSAGRNRSEEELEQRAEWAESKGFGEKEEQLFAGEFAEAPIEPPAGRSTFEQPKFRLAEPVSDSSRYARQLQSQTQPLQVAIVPNASSDSLIEKIRKAGYTTKGNQVLYGGDRYIDAEEWVRKMPHIELG